MKVIYWAVGWVCVWLALMSLSVGLEKLSAVWLLGALCFALLGHLEGDL